jgi:exodeoxyribonuclease V alpha subunit
VSHWFVRNKRKGLESLARSAADRSGEQIITGEVVSLNPSTRADGAWTLGQIRAEDGATMIPFLGADLVGCEIGCTVRLVGQWQHDATWGWQFRAGRVESRLPVTPDGIVRYLKANVPGCGEVRARTLAETFGAATLEVLSANPAAVRDAFPSGKIAERLERSLADWAISFRQKANSVRVEAALMGAGMTRNMAQRVLRHFRAHEVAEDVVLKRPYRLVEVPGIGFRRADALARSMGVAPADPSRIAAGVVYALEMLMELGHSAAPYEKLVSQARSALEISDTKAVEAAIERGVQARILVEEQGVIFLSRVRATELRVAERLWAMAARRQGLDEAQREAVRQIIEASGLGELQAQAVWAALESGVSVLTGRPGTGKTFTTAAIVRCCQAIGRSIQIAAPTGKAAARAAEVTGIEAKTIHRLIGLRMGETGEPVDTDVLVLDETSMTDLDVFDWLLRNLDVQRTTLLLVGDNNQLPSVGHGRVLGDIIDSGCVAATELTEIHRQGARSRIVENAHRLLDGKPLDLENRSGGDFLFVDIRQDEAIGPDGFPLPYDAERSRREQEYGCERISNAIDYLVRTHGAVPARDIQLLTPMRRGTLGVDSLNAVLQRKLNPDGAEGPFIGGGVRVRVGDRVIQTRNDYTVASGLFNGEQGEVISASQGAGEVRVRFGEREIALGPHQLGSLRLAWAITVHRSQGSEFPYTLMAYHTSHYQMLDQAVLYTGLTRAKKMFILIGTHRAIEITQRQGRRSLYRHTGLAGRLQAQRAHGRTRCAA